MRSLAMLAAMLALTATVHADAPDTRDPLDALLARTDKVAREVARLRGLPLKRPVPNEVVDRDELRRRLLALAADEQTKRETASDGLALARWGMIPLATSYEAMLIDLLTEQIAGYYDTDTKKLTISRSAGADAAWAELVLAHELQHALQDQAFDLDAFEKVPDADDDAAVARRALVEGDGVAVMVELMLTRSGMRVPWNNPRLTAQIEAALATTTPGPDGLAAAPLALREAMLFPYRAGFAFVAALRKHKPWSAVDAAFRRPPRSTEQILHPDAYLADEKPQEVAIAPLTSLPGYTVAHETVWGELGFDLFVRSHGVDARAAAKAAAGWGGDRMIVLAPVGELRPKRAVGIARLAWDSEADAIEAAEAATLALDRAIVGATVDDTPERTRWLALDGTVAWVERRDATLVIVIGAPAPRAAALAAELWPATPAS